MSGCRVVKGVLCCCGCVFVCSVKARGVCISGAKLMLLLHERPQPFEHLTHVGTRALTKTEDTRVGLMSSSWKVHAEFRHAL
eukprot:scaffold123938_cov18-Tisochrysis_lutea.AAC.1